MSHIPVLDIGGTHVTAAVIDTDAGLPVPRTVVRHPVAADAAAGELLDAIAGAADRADVREGAHWGVAIPGPFDYAAGVGRFRGIGKFESLHGVDVRAELLRRLPGRPRCISFINDADAFAVGEYRAARRPATKGPCASRSAPGSAPRSWRADSRSAGAPTSRRRGGHTGSPSAGSPGGGRLPQGDPQVLHGPRRRGARGPCTGRARHRRTGSRQRSVRAADDPSLLRRPGPGPGAVVRAVRSKSGGRRRVDDRLLGPRRTCHPSRSPGGHTRDGATARHRPASR